ncbi:MAG TPA: TlpA disulfide reductase family protein [Candidatus Baltobacteraceae bacterium]
MNRRQLAIATIGIVVLIVAAAVAWYVTHPSRQLQNASQSPIVGKAKVGQIAPEFQASTTGGFFDLAKTDKPVFLEVFATWCPHCQRETAVLDKLYAAYGSRVAFVAVSGSDTAMDNTSESSPLDVLNFAKQFNVRYPIAYDPLIREPNNPESVANLYLQGAFPTIAVIGKDKKVTYLETGEISYDDLAAQIKKVL